MKIVWRSLIFGFLLAIAASAANRIRIEAELDTATHTISGWVHISWPSLESPIDDLRFRLYANLRIDKPSSPMTESTFTYVDTLFAGELNVTESCRVTGTDLHCPIGRAHQPGDSLSVRLHFVTHVASLSHRLDRLFLSNGQYLLDGWFPMPAPRRGGQWVNVSYNELAELVADFFDFDVAIRLPESLQIIGPGLVSADTSVGIVGYTYALPAAHDFALYVSPAIESQEYKHGAMTIAIYAPTQSMFVADRIAEVAGQTLDTMGAWVSPYPFPELHIVVSELGFTGGMELPRMIVCSAPSGGGFLGLKQNVTIHEVIHQWFYGIINSDQAAAPWLDEAVCDYFTERVSRALYGDKNVLNWWGITVDYSGLQRLQGLPSFERLPINLPAAQYFSTNSYLATVYNKGAVTLRTLFAQLRPEDEASFWRRYYEQYRFGTPDETDFLRLLSEYEPYIGGNVAESILHNTGAIDYTIERISNEQVNRTDQADDSSVSNATDKRGFRSTVEYAMYNPLPLPVTMRISFNDGSYRDTLLVSRAGQGRLTINGDQPIIAAAIDPDGKIGLDRDLLNNSLSLSGSGAGMRLFSGLTFLIESLFSYVWGI